MKLLETFKKFALVGVFLPAFGGLTQILYAPQWSETVFTKTFTLDSEDNLISASEGAGLFKYNASRDLLWDYSPSGSILVNDIIIDNEDNIILWGIGAGEIEFSIGGELINYSLAPTYGDFIMYKMNPDGEVIWVSTFHKSSPDEFMSTAQTFSVDNENNIVATGSYSGEIDFDPSEEEYIVEAEESDLFILKLNEEGQLIWSKTLEGGTPETYSIAHDTENNILIGGSNLGVTDFDPSELAVSIGGTISGYPDAFTLKLDIDGEFDWLNMYEGNQHDFINDIEITDDGSLYVFGRFSSDSLDLDPSDEVTSYFHNPSGYNTCFLQKLNPDGSFQWGRLITSTTGNNYPGRYHGMDIDSNSDIFLTGYFDGQINLGGESEETFTTMGYSDIFIFQLDSEGNGVSGGTIGDTGHNGHCGLILDSEDNFFISGRIGSTSGTILSFHDSSYVIDGPNGTNFIAKYTKQTIGLTEGESPEKPIIQAYPNPASEFVNITGDISAITNIAIIDMTGKLMEYYDNNFHLLNVSSLPKGVYLIKINTVGTSYLKKLIIN